MRLLLALCLSVLLAGCAITPRGNQVCGFVRDSLDVADPGAASPLEAVAGANNASGSARAIRRALAAPVSNRAAVASTGPAMLFLSGGSQHGAFGAGYLDGWKAASPTHHLPDFSVVTGVSTGAILATFAFIDRPEVMTSAYAIESESQLLTPLVRVSDGEPTPVGYLQMVRKGAVADLAPLRRYLLTVVTDEVLGQVAKGARDLRLLRVGVVDVDTGGAVALDLTDMAQRQQAAQGADRDRLRACYVEAIVASASAPMAALPVFIDNRMYIDGGARFGAFSDEISGVLDQVGLEETTVQPTFYLIVNGDQRISSKCGRLDRSLCLPPDAVDPPQVPTGTHAKWDFLRLALRSEKILSNQVYRLSADSIAASALRRHLAPPNFAKIEPDVTDFRFELNDPVLGSGAMTCGEAEEKDRVTLHPIQFYPRYMHCLIAYGRARGAANGPRAVWP